jgi:hypothetical protein
MLEARAWSINVAAVDTLMKARSPAREVADCAVTRGMEVSEGQVEASLRLCRDRPFSVQTRPGEG